MQEKQRIPLPVRGTVKDDGRVEWNERAHGPEPSSTETDSPTPDELHLLLARTLLAGGRR